MEVQQRETLLWAAEGWEYILMCRDRGQAGGILLDIGIILKEESSIFLIPVSCQANRDVE